MSLSDKKLETAIVGLSVVMLVGMGYLLKAPVQSALGGQDVTYEMPRPKKSFFASLFDLGDRDVSRKYVNPFDKKVAEAKKPEAAKKEGPKKADAKKGVLQAMGKPTKSSVNKRPQVSVAVYGEKPTAKTWGSDGYSVSANTAQKGDGGSDSIDLDPANAENGKQKTSDEWQALLRSAPTQENMSKLITAFIRQEVDSETFYSIVSEMFHANRTESQALALMAVQSVYSTRSFTLTSQVLDILPSDLRNQANVYLFSYAANNRLGMLASVLKGGDSEAVTLAMQVVSTGYQNAKNGQIPDSDPRNLRGDVGGNTMTSYAQFIPIFQQLAGSADDSVAQFANNVLAQMQSTVAAL